MIKMVLNFRFLIDNYKDFSMNGLKISIVVDNLNYKNILIDKADYVQQKLDQKLRV